MLFNFLDLIVYSSTIVFSTLLALTWYIKEKWKAKIFILKKDDNKYFFVKRKQIYTVKENISYANRSYILSKPTYYEKGKPIYVFEYDNIYPLSFNELKEDKNLASKTDMILAKHVITQLISFTKGNIGIAFVIIMLICGLLGGYLLGQILPITQHTSTNATAVTTVTKTILPP